MYSSLYSFLGEELVADSLLTTLFSLKNKNVIQVLGFENECSSEYFTRVAKYSTLGTNTCAWFVIYLEDKFMINEYLNPPQEDNSTILIL